VDLDIIKSYSVLSKSIIYGFLICLAVIILFGLNIAFGSVDIPLSGVMSILMGNDTEKESWRFIILDSRLPQAVTALFAGAALAVSGLLLQTAFRNPLAGPDVFGINSGAALAVALVMLGWGGGFSAGNISVSGYMAIITAAFIGAIIVTTLIYFFSTLVRGSMMLLIIGIMIGYLSSSAVAILNFFSSEEGVRSYMIWGMGSFGNVSLRDLPLFMTVVIGGLVLSILLIKPLNALLLGNEYAENLGINIRRIRNQLLVVTGILTAIVTAFCGPVAFIGLATPHIARLVLNTDNHRQLLPVTMFTGALIALLCNFITYIPGEDGMIPLNAVTPLIGAPVIIYVIIKRR
jgi:iron complex transport system permease protein